MSIPLFHRSYIFFFLFLYMVFNACFNFDLVNRSSDLFSLYRCKPESPSRFQNLRLSSFVCQELRAIYTGYFIRQIFVDRLAQWQTRSLDRVLGEVLTQKQLSDFIPSCWAGLITNTHLHQTYTTKFPTTRG